MPESSLLHTEVIRTEVLPMEATALPSAILASLPKASLSGGLTKLWPLIFLTAKKLFTLTPEEGRFQNRLAHPRPAPLGPGLGKGKARSGLESWP